MLNQVLAENLKLWVSKVPFLGESQEIYSVSYGHKSILVPGDDSACQLSYKSSLQRGRREIAIFQQNWLPDLPDTKNVV